MRPLRFTAVVCSATVALVLASCRGSAPAPGSRDALAAAVSTTLPFSARLSGGFSPSQQGPTRAGNTPPLSPDVRIAIAELEKRATASPTPEALADLGVAWLVQGDVDRAITTLEDAALQQPSAAAWSDLSAAYLVRAGQNPDRKIESLARALEAAERSLKVTQSNPALFNRALARDGLAPYTGAPAGWREYVAAESDPAWRQLAQREAGNDEPVGDPLDEWEKRLRELRLKLAALDASFVTETVRLYPEASIELFDRELLLTPETRAQARLMAAAIHEVTGDPLARDEVAVAAVGGTALARAHAAYAKGRAQFDANAFAEARRSFEEAKRGFSQAVAPYRAWAATYLGTLDWYDREFDRSQQTLIAPEREARARGYRTLLARIMWQRGLNHQRQWRVTDALSAFRESANLFAVANQREYAVGAYHNLADVLRTLGETSESWTYVGRTLEELPFVRNHVRRYLFLYNTSLFASRQNLNEAALLFQNAAVVAAAKASPGVLAEATMRRAAIQLRRGDAAGGRADFDAAVNLVAALPEGAAKAYHSAELEVVRAQVGGSEETVPGLRRAIAFFEGVEPARIPGLYLLLARTPQIRASRPQADQALQSGIATLERQHAGVGDDALRISYFDDSWSLFQDMVTLQVAANDSSRAFEFAERSRARSLLASAQGSVISRVRSLDNVKASLPDSVLLVQYATLPDRVLIWSITRGNADLAERRIDERELERLVNQHRAAIQDQRDNPTANERLHEILVAPIASAAATAQLVVLIPDGFLQQLSFATLRHPTTRRFLIEDHALVLAPSASFFIDTHAAKPDDGRPTFASALLVGNPSAKGLRALPGAEAEVAASAPLYEQSSVLIGRNATRERFLELAPSHDVVHFGGHALVNPEFPLLSRLVFADEGGREQALFAHEISRVRFARTRLVFLAACSTASGAVSRGEGVLGIARPFLAGGVPVVIASQWDVDDQATEQLTTSFHRELKKLRDPVRALRAAQLAMLRSGNHVQASPRSWGAFVAVGTATRQAS